MRPSDLLRRFPSALLLLATLVIPGAAVTHGLAHHEEHEHAVEHGHAPPEGDGGPAVSAPDHGHEHQHADVDSAVRTRADAPIAAVPRSASALPSVRDTVVVSSVVVPRALLPRGDPSAGPPPRLRAPPAC